MKTSRTLAFAFALSLLASWSGLARAQASAADAQFDFGLSEMQAGRYDTGCPALGDSYRLDPKPGSLFTLAECEFRWGKVTAALTHYEAYLDLFSRMSPDQQSRQHGRDKLAAAKRDELRGRVPTLTLAFSRPPPKGTTVKRDGVPLGPAAVGAPVPLEAGEHVIEVLVPGALVRVERVTLAPGESRRLVLEYQEPDADADASSASSSSSSPSTTGSAGPSPMRMGAYVAGGIGAVGLGVGAIFGLVTLGHKSTIEEHCRDVVCDAVGKEAADDGRTSGAISTAGFVVGGLGLGTAIALFLLDPERSSSTATVRATAEVGSQRTTVGLSGRF